VGCHWLAHPAPATSMSALTTSVEERAHTYLTTH
jgi:hypothetical protein